jgi:calcineurin-like phosphoesterase family protein
MTAKTIPYLSFIPLILCSCYLKELASLKANEDIWNNPKNSLRIWALSDIQPKKRKHRKEFERAIQDINQNVPGIDLAIVVGDILQEVSEEGFDWYIRTINLSYIKEWYEIMGNHDLNPDDGKLYRKKIREDFHYAIQKGNILFIFMSDEVKSSATDISDVKFDWWRDLVVNNQDKIIVTVTHAPLEGSKIPFSTLSRRQITDSKRFTDVLKKYRVDIWLSAHLHVPEWFPNDINRVKKYNGTVFINVAGIRTEALGLKQSESRIITFVCGSDKVLVGSRNHTQEAYNNDLDVVFNLSKEYKCEG